MAEEEGFLEALAEVEEFGGDAIAAAVVSDVVGDEVAEFGGGHLGIG